MVVDPIRVQVDAGELLCDLIQQSRLGQPLHLCRELEALEYVPHRGGEGRQVAVEVLPDVVGIAQKRPQVEFRRVVEALLCLAEQERVRVDAERLLGRQLCQHRRLGGL